jgi:NitT/TauT family transport system permease protein
VGGLLWWRRIGLPGILPSMLTGMMNAAGGSWNAAIVAEVAAWGDTRLAAHGIGAYIAQATDAGQFQRVMLGVVVMALYVLLCNRLVWRPLHAHASRRATLG